MARPRVLLVVNPAATTTRPELRDLIIAALDGTVDLAVQPTRGRGHDHDLASLTIEAADGRSALPVHVDGDPLPPRRALTLSALPDALAVIV